LNAYRYLLLSERAQLLLPTQRCCGMQRRCTLLLGNNDHSGWMPLLPINGSS